VICEKYIDKKISKGETESLNNNLICEIFDKKKLLNISRQPRTKACMGITQLKLLK
jgi:hypothetical protein